MKICKTISDDSADFLKKSHNFIDIMQHDVNLGNNTSSHQNPGNIITIIKFEQWHKYMIMALS